MGLPAGRATWLPAWPARVVVTVNGLATAAGVGFQRVWYAVAYTGRPPCLRNVSDPVPAGSISASGNWVTGAVGSAALPLSRTWAAAPPVPGTSRSGPMVARIWAVS